MSEHSDNFWTASHIELWIFPLGQTRHQDCRDAGMIKKTGVNQKVAAILLLGILLMFLETVPLYGQTGMASWYSERDRSIKKHTASGEVFDDSKKTCASWQYDFGMHLKVVNVKNGKSVVCVVNDRGPAKRLKRRVLDLSKSAFRQIADLHHGVIMVSIVPLGSRNSGRISRKS